MDDHPVYDYNLLGERHYTITSEDEVPVGPAILSFAFNKSGPYQGEGWLSINGREEGQVPMPRLVPKRYSFEEGLEVGKDPQTPVTDRYESLFEFSGTIEKVVVEVKA